MTQLRTMFAKAPVVPVIAIDDIDNAVPLAKALIAGGIPVLEVTLRTQYGLEAIRRIKAEVEGAIVGVGTVVNCDDLQASVEAGSEFIITPGLTDELLAAGLDCGIPFMPAIATVSDLMRCLNKGLDTLKFFPAEAMGGVKTLKAFAGPFPQVGFCPTGGIGLNNVADYLALPSVLTVGGSWVCPNQLIVQKNWAAITQLAQDATDLIERLRNTSKE